MTVMSLTRLFMDGLDVAFIMLKVVDAVHDFIKL